MAETGGAAPVVGVDLGGTKILAGVVSTDHEILGRSKRPTPAEAGGPAILSAIVGAIDQALAEANLDRTGIAGIGIGSPGPLDPEAGVILFSSNLNVKDWPLAPDLSREIGRPCLLRNDVGVGGYGEFRLGAGRGCRDVLVAFVGTGIGGCCIVDGKVVHGATGNAGEVGHIVVKAAKRGEESVLASKVDKKSGKLKSGDLAAAVAASDPVALKEVERAAYYLGLGLGGLVNLLGPEVVIIGGGVTAALGAPFMDLIRASARQQILVDPGETIKIEPAALGDDAGILGAALMALERFGS